MTARSIILYPDQRLRIPADPIDAFDDSLHRLAQDLDDTLQAAQGLGLTAPHIGVSQSLVVIRLPGETKPRFYINPIIIGSSDHTNRAEEGSLSMPGVSDEVVRPAEIDLTYRTLDGACVNTNANGLLATCLQHEIDQLRGIFWISRLSRLRRERVVKRHVMLVRTGKL